MKKMKLSELVNEIPGGKGDDTKPSEVDQKQLEIGVAVEKEHTNDDSKAEEIAIDHLTENPEYYTDLVKGGLVDEPEALKIYKKNFGELQEKSVSKAQQMAAGIAHAAQKGEIPKSKLKGASKQMAKMDPKELKKFAKTDRKGLPYKKKQESLRSLISTMIQEILKENKGENLALKEDVADEGMKNTFDTLVARIQNYEKEYYTNWFLYNKKDDTKYLTSAIAGVDRVIRELESLKKDVFKKQIIIHNEKT